MRRLFTPQEMNRVDLVLAYADPKLSQKVGVDSEMVDGGYVADLTDAEVRRLADAGLSVGRDVAPDSPEGVGPGAGARPLTAKQQEVLEYLGAHGSTRQDELAAALGTTVRGVGVRLSALAWRDDVAVVSQRGNEGAASTIWRV